MTTNKLKDVKIPNVKIDKTTSRELMQQRNKEIAKALWAGKLTQAEQAAINQICLIYGLDPIMKQVVCLGGNIYITGGGLKVIGNRNKEEKIDGIQVIPANEQERKDYGCIYNDPTKDEYQHLFKAIIYKRGCSQPFIEWGEADKGNVKLYNSDFKTIADMAKTRAVNRALRNAYDVAFTSLEEVGYQPEQVIDVQPTEEPKEEPTPINSENKISETQRRKIFAELKKYNKTVDELKDYIQKVWGLESTKDITTSQMDIILSWMKL